MFISPFRLLHHPFKGATIELHYKEIERLDALLTDDSGKAFLKTAKRKKPESINIRIFGAQDLSVNLSQFKNEKEFRIERCIGFYEKNTRLKLWYKLKGNTLHYRKENNRLIKLKKVKLKK